MKKLTSNRLTKNISRNCSVQNLAGKAAALALCLILAQTVIAATGQVNVGTVYQQLEGFGGAGAYDAHRLTSHTKKNEIYALLFSGLGLDVYRIRNTYGYSSANITATGEIVAAAKTRNPAIKIMMSAWSPPGSLKSGGTVNGGTLAGGPSGYVYEDYADWWAESLTNTTDGWANVGVYPDYISIQNEPDVERTTYDTCKFYPTENSSYAGYDQAFEAVWQELYSRMGSNMPKMLAPETMGITGGDLGGAVPYITAMDNLDHVYGFAHHLYSDGSGSYSNPDDKRSAMTSFASTYGYKPLFQTEYAGDPTWADTMYTVRHIYNSLVYEGVTSYYYWSLFRYMYDAGVITLTSSSTYEIRPTYYALMHYAYFTDPGWYRIGASTSSTNLIITAFKSPASDVVTVVVINISINDYNLWLTLNGFTPTPGESLICQSTSSEYWSEIGEFDQSTPVFLPRNSITTIAIAGIGEIQNCSDVQAQGYRLASDLNGDCYVNYEDVEVITYYWLETGCGGLDNCEESDFEPDGDVDFVDFSEFGPQWMWCNDPEDPNCTPNW